MTRSTKDDDMTEELDYSNAPTPDYNVEDLVKMVIMKDTSIEGGNEAAYKECINQVAYKVQELELEYTKLSEKLQAKLEDIFAPTIKINLGVNEIVALCDLGASVSTILIHVKRIYNF